MLHRGPANWYNNDRQQKVGDLIIETILEHPDEPAAEIGKRVGRSSAQVCHVAKHAGLTLPPRRINN